ncbi:MAG: GNAT family N-acetyltransferase, partial [Chlorobi bacterium]|nr:GNAT family N-acetyltransferase [Chlorobiota bacterium]
MDSVPVRVRNLQPEDIKSAMGLVLSEGWNQTEKDWGLLIRNTQNVCLAAEVGGKLVATATAINYSNDVAWVGMVLVHKKYRGRGISK